jgi:hypothetical protein
MRVACFDWRALDRLADAGVQRCYWNATSVKLRSLRECKRSQSWDLSFLSAVRPTPLHREGRVEQAAPTPTAATLEREPASFAY